MRKEQNGFTEYNNRIIILASVGTILVLPVLIALASNISAQLEYPNYTNNIKVVNCGFVESEYDRLIKGDWISEEKFLELYENNNLDWKRSAIIEQYQTRCLNK